MSETPFALDCCHCAVTNDFDAQECWLCHRRDWREPPKKPPGRSVPVWSVDLRGLEELFGVRRDRDHRGGLTHRRGNWHVCFYRLPVDVCPGDRLVLDLLIDPSELILETLTITDMC